MKTTSSEIERSSFGSWQEVSVFIRDQSDAA